MQTAKININEPGAEESEMKENEEEQKPSGKFSASLFQF